MPDPLIARIDGDTPSQNWLFAGRARGDDSSFDIHDGRGERMADEIVLVHRGKVVLSAAHGPSANPHIDCDSGTFLHLPQVKKAMIVNNAAELSIVPARSLKAALAASESASSRLPCLRLKRSSSRRSVWRCWTRWLSPRAARREGPARTAVSPGKSEHVGPRAAVADFSEGGRGDRRVPESPGHSVALAGIHSRPVR